MSSGDNNSTHLRLKVFQNFAPEDEALRQGYAYLIRSSVRMPELYPLLGELLFASRVVKQTESANSAGTDDPPNAIGMFIEDSPDNLIRHLKGPDSYTDGSDITGKYFNDLVNNEEKGEPPRMAAWLDTFGSFHDAGGDLDEKEIWPSNRKQDGEIKEKHKWWSKSIAGPGNPMAIMRFFRQVQEKLGGADLNVFLLNSLSNLYRNLGLAESAAFLKTMLNESIWSAEPEPDAESSEQKIRYKSGLFFAVLQEGVLDKQEASYLESFFDGIIKVEPCELDEKFRVARVHIEVLPELLQSHNDFVYIPMWQYEKRQQEFGADWTQAGLKYISTHSADGCVVKKKENGCACEKK